MQAIDPTVIRKQAIALRPGHTCVVDIPEPEDWKKIWKMGRYSLFNVHFPVTFDDGIKWLVRVRRPRQTMAPTELLHMMSASEVQTLKVLKESGAKVPGARLPPEGLGNVSKDKSDEL